MNDDTIKGKANTAKGKVKQVVGEAVGNEKLANSGTADQVKGAAQETLGKVKDTVKEVKTTAKVNAAKNAETTRDKIVNGAANLKNAISAKLDHVQHHEQDARHDISQTQ